MIKEELKEEIYKKQRTLEEKLNGKKASMTLRFESHEKAKLEYISYIENKPQSDLIKEALKYLFKNYENEIKK